MKLRFFCFGKIQECKVTRVLESFQKEAITNGMTRAIHGSKYSVACGNQVTQLPWR